MQDEEQFHHQQRLLQLYRANLRHLLEQAARYNGEAAAPLSLANEIREARQHVRQLKADLRAAGLVIPDAPGDEPRASGLPAFSPAGGRRWSLVVFGIIAVVALAGAFGLFRIGQLFTSAPANLVGARATAAFNPPSPATATPEATLSYPLPTAGAGPAQTAAPMADAETANVEVAQLLLSTSSSNYRLEPTMKNGRDSDVLIKKISLRSLEDPLPPVLSGCQDAPNTLIVSDTLSIKSIGDNTIAFEGYIANNEQSEYQYPVRGIIAEYQCHSSLTLEFDVSLVLPAGKFASFYIVFPQQFRLTGDASAAEGRINLANYPGFSMTLETDVGEITSSQTVAVSPR